MVPKSNTSKVPGNKSIFWNNSRLQIKSTVTAVQIFSKKNDRPLQIKKMQDVNENAHKPSGKL